MEEWNFFCEIELRVSFDPRGVSRFEAQRDKWKLFDGSRVCLSFRIVLFVNVSKKRGRQCIISLLFGDSVVTGDHR